MDIAIVCYIWLINPPSSRFTYPTRSKNVVDTDTKNSRTCYLPDMPRTSKNMFMGPWGYTAIPCCTPIQQPESVWVKIDAEIRMCPSWWMGQEPTRNFWSCSSKDFFDIGNLHRIFTSMTKQPFPVVCVSLVSRTGMDMRILVYRIDIAKEPQP